MKKKNTYYMTVRLFTSTMYRMFMGVHVMELLRMVEQKRMPPTGVDVYKLLLDVGTTFRGHSSVT